ncbi:hypothetical protein PC41400_14475 [Paenibacillus chitinolyticus]|uniref:Ig-like domain-containing protein n=1 Tax=Paenibacillus chitinolyticus TaxID=79263 RepID=A0A410WWN1_9BACL|nr:Ig-like domain-containing protein [Paenibacillus chitinolyticus]MCY9594007.1 Ig-like domain-containing protein [Paenibacillus chitinolyticus]MCY9598552.1 Ig-like domain-containing protein [Paenibacillus chitinolyticus]QAV18818.1 hypothetical protein PC41400_14475 [Paenibacillus chitinolyticus]
MSWQERFALRMNAIGTTIRQREINNEILRIGEIFSDSPSYALVYQNDAATPADVWITDNSDSKGTKDIVSQLKVPLYAGDLIEWNYEKWLITSMESISTIYYAGTMSKCLGNLKWLNGDGLMRDTWFTFNSISNANSGVNEGQIINLGNEYRHILIPLNENTKLISKDKRFILDQRAWKAIGVDRISKRGIINLTLKEDAVANSDNLELEVADYRGNTANYSLAIINDDPSSISVGFTLQLRSEVKNNGTLVSKPIIWSANNEAVATVNESGILSAHSVGQVIITASLADNPSISTSIDVTIVDIPKLYTIEIESNSTLPHEIKNGQSKTYIAKVYENSSLVLENLEWQLFSDDQISPTSLGLINSQTNESCIVKNNRSNSGYIQLKVSLVKDASIYRWLRLQMKPLV